MKELAVGTCVQLFPLCECAFLCVTNWTTLLVRASVCAVVVVMVVSDTSGNVEL